MTTYDRNRNAITTGSRVMVSGTGHTGKILSIDTEAVSYTHLTLPTIA